MLKTDVKLKQKILGVLMRNARNRAGLSLEETADLLGLTADTLADYEFGRKEADLPLLEGLGRICNVPVSYFWEDNPLPPPDRDYSLQKAIVLRRKVIGVLLSQARTQADRSPEELAELLECPVEKVSAYEMGKAALPLSQLKHLSPFLNVSLDYFADGLDIAEQALDRQTNGNAGSPSSSRTETGATHLSHFSDDVQEFLADPANQLYVKLAMRLHGLSSETLRALAEGILDITY